MPPPSRKNPKPLSTPSSFASPTPAPAPITERSEFKGIGKPKTPVAGALRQPSYDEIARRAYEIYASRGYTPGDQTADWLEAERQLKAGL